MAVIAFDFLSGRMVTRVAAASWSWTRELSAEGSFECTVSDVAEAARQNLVENAREWRTVLVDADWVDGPTGRVLDVHASGIVHSRKFEDSKATFSCAGFASILSRLLVVNHELANRKISGQILDHESEDIVVPPDWQMSHGGALADIMVKMLTEAGSYVDLPVTLPDYEGGTNNRVYYSTDLATVLDRFNDLSNVENGPEYQFTPHIIDGLLSHSLDLGHPELRPEVHRIDGTLDGVPVTDVTMDASGADMATDVWASGGKQDDKILVSRATSASLTDRGWPQLMVADTSHQSVSEIDTLAAHARVTLQRGSEPSEVFSFKVGRDYATISPGDWVDLRWQSWFMPTPKWWALKVLQVSGDEGEWLSVSCRERVENYGSL